jgi:chromosomal replication initiation ATPase DnaA
MSLIRLTAKPVEWLRIEYRDSALPGFGLHRFEAYRATWRRVRDRLRSEVGTNAFEHWLRDLELQRIVEGALLPVLIAPTSAVQHWVYIHHFGRLLREWQIEDKRVELIDIKLPPGMNDDEFDDQIPDEPEHGEIAPEHQDAWRRIVDRLKPEIGEEASSWLEKLELHETEPLGVALTLVAPTELIRDRLCNYCDLMSEIWQAEDERVGVLLMMSPPSQVRSPVGQNTKMSDLLVTRRLQKNPGGRAPKFDWEALWFELIRIAQIDGFHSRQELRQRALDFIAKDWPDEPSDSVLREKFRRLGDLLDLPVN